ncbi:MAG: hypothetical protein ACO3P8_12050 [Steroidobacteraceae bacterium]
MQDLAGFDAIRTEPPGVEWLTDLQHISADILGIPSDERLYVVTVDGSTAELASGRPIFPKAATNRRGPPQVTPIDLTGLRSA